MDIAHRMLYVTSCSYSCMIGYLLLYYKNKSIYDVSRKVFEKDQTQLLTAYKFVAKVSRLLRKDTENNDQVWRSSLEIVELFIANTTRWVELESSQTELSHYLRKEFQSTKFINITHTVCNFSLLEEFFVYPKKDREGVVRKPETCNRIPLLLLD